MVDRETGVIYKSLSLYGFRVYVRGLRKKNSIIYQWYGAKRGTNAGRRSKRDGRTPVFNTPFGCLLHMHVKLSTGIDLLASNG